MSYSSTYYVSPDGLGTATGGTGTELDPYKSLSQLPADLTDTLVWFDPSGGPDLNAFRDRTISNTKIKTTGGKGYVLNAILVDPDTAEDLTGTFDVWEVSASVATKPEGVVENWLTNKVGERHYGHLEEQGSLAALRTNRGWYHTGSTLYVSVPKGVDPSTRAYYAGQAGDTTRHASPFGLTSIDMVWGIALEAGDGNGYCCRLTGAPRSCVFIRNEFHDGQYHNFGAVGDSADSVILIDCISGCCTPNTDSSVVFFAFGTGGLKGNRWIRGRIYLDPLMDPDQAAVGSGVVRGVAIHHGASADPTEAQGVIFDGLETVWSGLNPTQNCYDLAQSAGNTNHSAPSNPLVVDDYPVIFRDCTLGGHGMNLGSASSNSEVHVALQRCAINMNASGVTSGLSGLGQYTVAAGSSSAVNFLAEACTFSVELNDITNRVLFAGNDSGGSGSLRLRDCSVYVRGTYANNTAIFNGSNDIDLFKADGCIFDAEDSINLIRGQIPRSALEFSDNLYGSNLGGTFHPFLGISRAGWLSTDDPTGASVSADWVSATTLEPGPVIRALSNTAGSITPRGINNRTYNGVYGAFQYGATDDPPVVSPPLHQIGGFRPFRISSPPSSGVNPPIGVSL